MSASSRTLLLALLLPASAAHAEWADWVFDAELTGRYDANLNRASRSSEEDGDFSARPVVRVGRVYQLAERTRGTALAELGGELYARFEDLHAVDVSGELAVLHKFGLGDAPWARLSVRGGHREVRDDPRSGAQLSAGLTLGRRFSPRLDARLGYAYERHFGGGGPGVVPGMSDDVFDQRRHRITLSGDFLASDRLLLVAGFSYQRGDFDSNARSSRFEVLARRDVEAVALDGVFGGWVYRVDGNAYAPVLRLNVALDPRWSVDAGYRFQYAEGGGLRYRNHVVSASLLFRY